MSRENAFSLDDQRDVKGGWDYVINLAAETKLNQTRTVYEQGIVPLSVGCAELAAKHQVKRYIELSDSHCYSAKKVNSSTTTEYVETLNLKFCFINYRNQLKKRTRLNLIH